MADTTKLDEAILAYRAEPSEGNRLALLAIQEDYVKDSMRRNAEEYILRTS